MNIEYMGGERFDHDAEIFVPYEPDPIPHDEMVEFLGEVVPEIIEEYGFEMAPDQVVRVHWLDCLTFLGANVMVPAVGGNILIEAYRDPDSNEWVVNDTGLKAEGVLANTVTLKVLEDFGFLVRRED